MAIIWEKNEPGEQEEITYKYVILYICLCMPCVQCIMYYLVVQDEFPSILTLSTLHCRELLDQTCQIANVLRNAEVQKGDKVMIYMPMMPLAVAAMLACARMGAIHW